MLKKYGFLIKVAAFSFVLYVFLSQFDIFEMIYDYTREYEDANIDEIVLILPPLLLFFMIYNNKLFKELKLYKENLESIVDNKTKTLKLLISEKDELISEREKLLYEVHHRVKNNLQIIYNILDMGLKRMENEYDKNIVVDVMGRIHSIATVHKQLYNESNLNRVEFNKFMLELINHLQSVYNSEDIRIDVDMDDISFNLQKAVPVGLVLQELFSNVFKYAYGNRPGVLRVSAKAQQDFITIEVQDDGPGLPEGFSLSRANSLGLKLVKDIVEMQLQGEFSIHSAEGVTASIRIPA